MRHIAYTKKKMARVKDTKSLVLVRNLVGTEVIAYLCFLVFALSANWAFLYRQYFPSVSHYFSFTILEFLILGIVQVGLILFVVRWSAPEEQNIHEIIRNGEH